MRPRILLLDDEETIRKALSIYFEEKGYAVAVASSADAIALGESEPFDLCIFDINLAGESGLELLRYFKSNHPALPIIIFTGMGDEEDLLEQATLRGASGFMRKTDPIENLFEMVKSYVGKP